MRTRTRTRLNRKKPLRSKRRTISDKTLDDAARAVVFKRDGWRCTLCGTPYGLQWSHLRSRRYKTTCWLPQNAMTHCGGCHEFKWHQPPPGFDPFAWHRERFPGYLELVDSLLLFKGPKPKLDRAELLGHLQRELERVEPNYVHDLAVFSHTREGAA